MVCLFGSDCNREMGWKAMARLKKQSYCCGQKVLKVSGVPGWARWWGVQLLVSGVWVWGASWMQRLLKIKIF